MELEEVVLEEVGTMHTTNFPLPPQLILIKGDFILKAGVVQIQIVISGEGLCSQQLVIQINLKFQSTPLMDKQITLFSGWNITGV